MKIKLNRLTRADLDFLQAFCEAKLCNALGDMRQGYGNPMQDMLDATVLLERMTAYVPSDEQTPHRSDCAVHNGPALPAGPCDCGAVKPTQAKKKAA